VAQYINSTRLQKELFKRTEGYAENVRKIYMAHLQQLIDLVKDTELEDGKPFSFSEYGYGDKATKILRKMYSSVYQEIRGDVTKEWMLSNTNNDELVKSIFGKNAINNAHLARFFNRNKEAMDAFFARKTGEEGLNLSQRVWKYVTPFREELENALDLAIGEGTGANRLATKVKEYLQEPDKFYRRFRVKTGEDENGNPVYGRVWKRRIFDNETQSHRWVDDNPKNYNPGQGVYRSSYRNAQRLTRTETNMAYRAADYERWQQLDFVVGIEIKLSNNHPVTDICDDLQGVYPKTFKWTGWHPQCRCYMVPILAKLDEIWAQIDKTFSENEPEPLQSVDAIVDYPDNFTKWVKNNEARMEVAKSKGTLPYFIKDNTASIEGVLKPLSPEQKYHNSLVEQYGEEAVQKLYGAFDGFKTKISAGDLPHQIKKLNFEIDWIGKNGKYPTSSEMVKMLEKELATVQAKYNLEQAVQAAEPVLSYKSKSSSLKAIAVQLNDAINAGNADAINQLTQQASDKIAELEKARIKKLSKQHIDGMQLDLWMTPKEKEHLGILQLNYDDLFAQNGSQWDYSVNKAYTALAEYKKDLAEKYIHKQGKLVKLPGETEETAAKALAEYKQAQVDRSANTPVGGVFNSSAGCTAGDWKRIESFSKKSGIPADDLSLVTRYTYGSKWCNNWGYGVADSYFGKVNDYGGLCQKYYPAMNSVLEKLPRFEGTVFTGIRMDSTDMAKYIDELKGCMKSGKPFVNKAFLSSTTNISVTRIFGDDVMLVIKSKNGADVRKITHAPYVSEAEILFRGGSRFKVVAVAQETTKSVYGYKAGTWVIQLEEV
jgi:hypothetical protein